MTFSVYKLGGPHLGMVLSTIELNHEYYGTQDIENIQFASIAIGWFISPALSYLFSSFLFYLPLLFPAHVLTISEDYFTKKDNAIVENRIRKVKNRLKEVIKDISLSLGMHCLIKFFWIYSAR